MLVVDDHPVLRDGLAALLRQMGPETVVLQAGDAAQALALVAQHADLDAVVLESTYTCNFSYLGWFSFCI